jgi:cytoskeleton protein RodZ
MNPIEQTNNVTKVKADSSQDETLKNTPEELSEDIEVMGPGQILSDARKKMRLTQEDVATKLNFRTTLVDEIENEVFDTNLPETFNRGYLRNYAKLVNVSQEDVMASYEQLNVAKTQASDLQSFSKGTEKLAESNRIMWISYLILAILIGSTVVWWQNNTEQILKEKIDIKSEKIADKHNQQSDALDETQTNLALTSKTENNKIESIIEESPASSAVLTQESANTSTPSAEIENVQRNEDATATIENISVNEPEATLTNITFMFSGDCWVNISDGTGERIAWGVKKLGYVMKISGQAPFNVTLGKPELVAINFSGEIIDMSQFNVGNIAKFTLPVTN